MLELKSIYKQYGDKPILDNVSLHLKKGEIALLLGHSGVGKSTLLRVINNLESFDRGEICIDGASVAPELINKLHKIGFVFQDFNLFNHLDALHNITLPLEVSLKKNKGEASAMALKLLAQYGLHGKEQSLPSQLSGGQKQRLAIARAIAMGSEVLCMDEPTSALDPTATSQVAEHMNSLSKQGYAILIATHDRSLIEKLDCTVHLMKQGKIIESGNSQEILSRKDRFPLISSHLWGD